MTKPSPTITEREERLWHDLAALTREQSRLVQEIVALTLGAADPRAIPVGAVGARREGLAPVVAIYDDPDEAPPMGDTDDDGGLCSPSLHGRPEFDDGISLDALDARGDAALRSREPRALDVLPLSTVSAVPTVPTPANDDGGQP